jgi:hypothetical protein
MPRREEPRIVVLATREHASRWAQLLTLAGHQASVEDPAKYAPDAAAAAGAARAVVVDVDAPPAQAITAALRQAKIPVILMVGDDAKARIEALPDALTVYVEWLADAYACGDDQLLPAVGLALEPLEASGECLHLTFRGTLPPAEVQFPLGTAFPLHRSEAVFVGRSRSTPLQLASPHVGRAHAVVAALPGNDLRAVVSDLSSTNGTFVRGQRALSELIAAGDELYVAGYRFVVEVLPTFSA